MTITAQFVLDAVLQHNFFPAYSRWKEEMPPIFDSTSFSPTVARQLASASPRKSKHYPGYDSVSYRLTRFNGLSRPCAIIHPKPYSDLALQIHDNWTNIEHIATNETSTIRPQKYADGRLVIMNYETRPQVVHAENDPSFGKKYEVRTDISNFYPSFYSHMIPGAIVGIDNAKSDRTIANWYNALDSAVMSCNRRETRGVATGPGTSLIVTELVLEKIDQVLTSKYEYKRYIDDYVKYCSDETEAIDFVTELARNLEEHRLELNVHKTEIVRLPTERSSWITDLEMALPQSGPLTKTKINRYLNYSLRLAHNKPDGSVLKYASKRLIGIADVNGGDIEIIHFVLEHLMNLAFHHPVLIPLLDELLHREFQEFGKCHHGEELLLLLQENTRFARTDAVCWLLDYCRRFKVAVNGTIGTRVIVSSDCMPILLLYIMSESSQKQTVVNFANGLKRNDLYDLDRYWLLMYQLFLEGEINNPYHQDNTFGDLQAGNVDFLRLV